MSEPTLDLRAVEALLNACAAHGELTAIVPCGNLRALYDLAVRAVAAGAGDPHRNFADRMRACVTGDEEGQHAAADRLMCSTLRDLGYGEGVAVFEAMGKWYA